jgi:hypothetical protein
MSEAEAELRDVISVLLSPPILSPVNTQKDFVIFVDSSDFAVGWAIGQLDNNNMFQVNYYGGHQLPRPSLSWPIHHKEIFSAVSAIRTHEPMFVGKQVTIVTDNCSLQNLKTMQNSSGRLQRWTSYLGNFDITYKHVPGHRNMVADCLSRLFEDGSDEMKMAFTPSALTDCSDYILCMDEDSEDNIECPGSWKAYSFVVVNSESSKDNNTAADVNTTHTPTNTDDYSVSSENAFKLNPNAEPFATKYSKNLVNDRAEAETLNNYELDEEFYDCNGDSENLVNVLTRQQARLAAEQENAIEEPIQVNQQATEVADEPQANIDFGVDDLSDHSSSADAESLHLGSPVSDGQVTLDGIELDITPHDYRSDDEFADMYHFKVAGELPTDDRAARTVMLTHDMYTVDNNDNRLYRITIPRAKRERTVKPLQVQLCLPLRYQYFCADYLHRTFGHPSTERLYLTMKERYYCRNLFDLAKSIASTCSDCQETKRDYAQVNAPLHPHPVQGFMEQWHLDHASLCRPTPSGHKYLLVCIDSYSGWPEIYPVFTTSSLETAKCLVDLIARFGLMKRVITDRGTSFSGRTFNHVGRMLGIHHKMIASLSPQSNSKAERAIGQLKAQLKVMCETDDQIVDRLPFILLGMRATVSSVTKVSPYHAIFGRPFPLPLPGCDLDTPRQPAERLRVAEKQYLDKVRAQLDDLETRVKLNIAEDKAEVKRAYDNRFNTHPEEFKLGDLVWLKDRGVKAHSPSVLTKRKFIGPFFITALPPGREGEGISYFLTHSKSGRRWKHPVPGHRLKRCNTDRTDVLVKYPDLERTNTNTSPPAQVNQSTDRIQTTNKTQTSKNKPDETDRTGTSIDKQLSATKPAEYCQAKIIKRQRFAPDGTEFLVKFCDNSVEWVNQSQVSPALKADYLIKKNNRSRSRSGK